VGANRPQYFPTVSVDCFALPRKLSRGKPLTPGVILIVQIDIQGLAVLAVLANLLLAYFIKCFAVDALCRGGARLKAP